jgi:putative salt-induced outer membrane protein YdiY
VGPGVVVERLGNTESTYLTLRVGERFEYKLSDRARLWQSLEYLPQVDRFSNYLVNAEVGIEADLTKDKKLSLRTFLQDSYRNEPAPGRKQNDMKLVSAIAYKF